MDLVRRRDEPVISLVAVDSDQVVGHILFSPVSIESSQQTHRAVGIGRQLIQEGLQVCRQAGYEIVVVLGHPSYYPRFGFMLAREQGIHWEQEVPGDAFMVMELKPGALQGCQGTARYLPEFMSL